jgi:hypothetical protein
LLLTFSPEPEQMNALPVSLMIGEPVFSSLPMISTVVFCVIFIAVAIRRFNRQEFLSSDLKWWTNEIWLNPKVIAMWISRLASKSTSEDAYAD